MTPIHPGSKEKVSPPFPSRERRDNTSLSLSLSLSLSPLVLSLNEGRYTKQGRKRQEWGRERNCQKLFSRGFFSFSLLLLRRQGGAGGKGTCLLLLLLPHSTFLFFFPKAEKRGGDSAKANTEVGLLLFPRCLLRPRDRRGREKNPKLNLLSKLPPHAWLTRPCELRGKITHYFRAILSTLTKIERSQTVSLLEEEMPFPYRNKEAAFCS